MAEIPLTYVNVDRWHDIAGQDLDRFNNSKVEKNQLQGWAVEYMNQIQTILSKVPRPMILLLKTNDTLRHLDNSLGTPINSFVVMARYCTKGIERHRSQVRISVAVALCLLHIFVMSYSLLSLLFVIQSNALFVAETWSIDHASQCQGTSSSRMAPTCISNHCMLLLPYPSIFTSHCLSSSHP
jgi:hypothetical protein